ncbi:MAG TPA: hypothetical protein VNF51_02820 [Candidatus Paceibacterota bacterium]|nr:hypothetical protein [Candidatus Paceibacterota bacterium]
MFGESAMQPTTNGPATDADISTAQLAAPTTGTTFVEAVKTVAHHLGYQVSSMNPTGGDTWAVEVSKTEEKTVYIIGRKMTYTTVTLQLEPNGRTVEISAQIVENNTANKSGDRTKKVADQFATALLRQYQMQVTHNAK